MKTRKTILSHHLYCRMISLACLSMMSNISLSQVVTLNAEAGVAFGLAADDPLLRNGLTNSKDLDLDLAEGRAFSIFSDGDVNPTFRAGEGNSGSVEAGKWYRIAKSDILHIRPNATFSLRDTISPGHNNITFKTGMSYGSRFRMSMTLLSNSGYVPVFSEVRYLSKGNFNEIYLEVKVEKTGPVAYSIMENLSKGGWIPVDWEETTSIPADYTETKYDLSKLFSVSGQTTIMSVDRTEGVAVTGDLKVNGASVLTTASAPLVSGYSSLDIGSNDVASGEIALALGFFNTASGSYSLAQGEWSEASGFASVAMGVQTSAFGDQSFTMGLNTSAHGQNSFAIGLQNQAFNDNSLVLGQYAQVVTDDLVSTSWKGDNLHSVLSVGIGTDAQNRKNALTVLQDGSIELGKDSVTDEIPLKVNSDGSVILSKPQGDISMGIYGQ